MFEEFYDDWEVKMQGRIISFDTHTQEGLIRSDSGNVYKFNCYNYPSLSPTLVGEIASFEVDKDSSKIQSLYVVLLARYVRLMTETSDS